MNNNEIINQHLNFIEDISGLQKECRTKLEWL